MKLEVEVVQEEAREEAVLEEVHVGVVGSVVVVKVPAVKAPAATKNLPGSLSAVAKAKTRSQIPDPPTQNKNHQALPTQNKNHRPTEVRQATTKPNMAVKESLHHHRVTIPSTTPIKTLFQVNNHSVTEEKPTVTTIWREL